MSTTGIKQVFSTNRAEELGFDVWDSFVLPPFFDSLSLGESRKPRVIVGGRGCGKTMLLRYLSHESTFSKNREDVPKDAVSHIGLYWRADTQFARSMECRGVAEDTWAAAFRHLIGIVVAIEVVRSIESIGNRNAATGLVNDLASIDLSSLRSYSTNFPTRFDDIRGYLEQALIKFEIWVNDVRGTEQPSFIPGNGFVRRLVQVLRDQFPGLRDSVFYVYIDEYENLAVYQQRIINTWLKHSEPPLIFNLAMKRNGFKTRATEGDESLNDIHDFREIDLEAFDLEKEYPTFAAEIFLHRLGRVGVPTPEINSELLKNPSMLSIRKSSDYRERVQNRAKAIFPSKTNRELAMTVFTDQTLKRRLTESVAGALAARKATGRNPSDFISEQFPEASVVVPALLYRESLSVDEVLEEFEKLTSGIGNRFTGKTNWVHNNFVGCYLLLFDGLVRACPFYSGFLTFCYMSRGNLRHFLELCHKSLSSGNSSEGDPIGVVSIELQAEAARRVAADLLTEIRSFGPRGNSLHTFVLRLGSLLSLSQQRLTQSEPERSHFCVLGGRGEFGEKEHAFVSEAVKWSVLFEEKGTKKKNDTDPEGVEYVLNPIYAPYFHISYRKKRRLELSSDEAIVLISGSYDEVRKLLREYQSKWSVDLSVGSLPLFAHLEKVAEE